MAVAWTKGLACLERTEVVLEDTPERKTVQRFTPIGVSAAIVPWNFPPSLMLNMMYPGIKILLIAAKV